MQIQVLAQCLLVKPPNFSLAQLCPICPMETIIHEKWLLSRKRMPCGEWHSPMGRLPIFPLPAPTPPTLQYPGPEWVAVNDLTMPEFCISSFLFPWRWGLREERFTWAKEPSKKNVPLEWQPTDKNQHEMRPLTNFLSLGLHFLSLTRVSYGCLVSSLIGWNNHMCFVKWANETRALSPSTPRSEGLSASWPGQGGWGLRMWQWEPSSEHAKLDSTEHADTWIPFLAFQVQRI